ncbi:ABC transporter ATP-binding protein [Caproiciproducens sp. NJN-50]|uniref:ABC transporter ATP-binding protein n=1 Tax=Acutalibacteraceae TaxID=3082771 RepID=UPI000FFE0FBC|nr:MULTISPECIES: ABC transporter ATP-binding protein [Acutalibacteraceae]QAT48638.1 ABC transporter ATP-binding protein [Caproiciproducens sp. NJN-50]
MGFSIKNISYQYKPNAEAVLKDVSFEIREAQVTAIVGPSGCGKTTLVNILSGVIPELMPMGVYEGSFDVGKDISISVVSQSPENQLFGYGVEDAISFGIENMGLESGKIAERVEYVLDLLNIQHLRRRSVATLSGGQRQAVCIASVLAMRPDILIMDEPVSSLDPEGKRMIQSILNQLRETGQTTVIVDNNLDWFSGIVDHVIGLSEGRVVFNGTKDEFFRDFAIQETLGVTVPQEVEIYRRLSEKIEGLELFDTVDGAKRVLGRYLPSGKPRPIPAASSDDGDEILRAEGISKTFQDGFHALIDVSAGFGPGKVISIIGQNGSGKTTFVKHLNGLYRPTEGTVRYKGVGTAGKSVAQISRDIILVFQNPEHMLFEESVMKELTFCARAQGVEFSEAEALDVLERYGLLEVKDELPLNLSMGKKHLLTILSVLFSSAEVVILDEPTLGMDLHIKSQLENIIRNLAQRGKTVIIISHEIPLVFQVSDRILVLNNGVKLAYASRASMAERDELFEKINISLPPVVLLSKYFGFSEVCCDVGSFVGEAAGRISACRSDAAWRDQE